MIAVLWSPSTAPRPRLRQPSMQFPDSIADPTVEVLRKRGYGRVRNIDDVTPASASFGTRHLRYETAEGPVFCKRVTRPLPAVDAEAASLRALRQATFAGGLLRTPEPLATGSLPLGGSFLLMEWVEQGPSAPPSEAVLEQLGIGIAMLHAAPQPPPRRGFGFECDTFLGEWQQANGWSRSHADFFVGSRLEPLLTRVDELSIVDPAVRSEERRTFRRLSEGVQVAANRLLCDLATLPALLHGDLRIENVGTNDGLQPVLYHPSCWYGLPEFDLAASKVSGGDLGSAFHDAYHAQMSRQPGFEERQLLYVLYHSLHRLSAQGSTGGRGSVSERLPEVMRQMRDVVASVEG